MLDYCETQPASESISVAFFYCSFTDAKKRRTFNLLCSFLLQLAQKLPEIPRTLAQLYEHHKHSEPPIYKLEMTLRSVLEGLTQSFLIVDALDECVDETGTRTEILTLLSKFSDWALPNVHVLVSSRKELDIEKSLTLLTSLKPICLQTRQQKDINTYVKSVLATDPDLEKWSPEVREEIRDTLTRMSNGM